MSLQTRTWKTKRLRMTSKEWCQVRLIGRAIERMMRIWNSKAWIDKEMTELQEPIAETTLIKTEEVLPMPSINSINLLKVSLVKTILSLL